MADSISHVAPTRQGRGLKGILIIKKPTCRPLCRPAQF